jgi:DNA-binding NarL/FixJ family response regulator
MNIRVTVIDDQDLIRVGVEYLLNELPQVEFMGGFADVKSFCEVPVCHNTDVLVLDDTLPWTTVFESVSLLRKTCPRTALLVLGSQLNGLDMQILVKLGVLGFITKDEPLREMLGVGLYRVYHRKVYLSPEAALITREQDEDHLTPRQAQVLERIAQGKNVQQTAQELGISAGAVYAARARLRETLAVQTDAQLGTEARRRGLIRDA